MKQTEIAGYVFLLGAVLGFLYAVWKSIRYLSSVSWPSVKGKVLHAEVFKDHSSAGNTHRPLYMAKIDYEYAVHGKTYTNNTINVCGDVWTSYRDRPAHLVSKYATDKEIRLHYNPSNPEDSYLERTAKFMIIGVFAAVGSAVLGFILLNWESL